MWVCDVTRHVRLKQVYPEKYTSSIIQHYAAMVIKWSHGDDTRGVPSRSFKRFWGTCHAQHTVPKAHPWHPELGSVPWVARCPVAARVALFPWGLLYVLMWARKMAPNDPEFPAVTRAQAQADRRRGLKRRTKHVSFCGSSPIRPEADWDGWRWVSASVFWPFYRPFSFKRESVVWDGVGASGKNHGGLNCPFVQCPVFMSNLFY